jgi:hypothetical protein
MTTARAEQFPGGQCDLSSRTANDAQDLSMGSASARQPGLRHGNGKRPKNPAGGRLPLTQLLSLVHGDDSAVVQRARRVHA